MPQTYGECPNCKQVRALERHRIIPGYQGGDYSPDNVVELCWDCHKKEHDNLFRELGVRARAEELQELIDNYGEDEGKRMFSERQAERGRLTHIRWKERDPEGYSESQREKAKIRWNKAGINRKKIIEYANSLLGKSKK